MMAREILRHVSISADPKVAAQQNGENARDANEVLVSKLTGYTVQVRRYAAIGATTSKVYLAPGPSRPVAVVLVRAALSNDPGADIGAVGRSNFYHDSFGLGVYEPSGLTADTMYDLTFLVLE